MGSRLIYGWPRRIFEVLDEDGSGQVSTDEFDAAFEIPECRP